MYMCMCTSMARCISKVMGTGRRWNNTTLFSDRVAQQNYCVCGHMCIHLCRCTLLIASPLYSCGYCTYHSSLNKEVNSRPNIWHMSRTCEFGTVPNSQVLDMCPIFHYLMRYIFTCELFMKYIFTCELYMVLHTMHIVNIVNNVSL